MLNKFSLVLPNIDMKRLLKATLCKFAFLNFSFFDLDLCYDFHLGLDL